MEQTNIGSNLIDVSNQLGAQSAGLTSDALASGQSYQGAGLNSQSSASYQGTGIGYGYNCFGGYSGSNQYHYHTHPIPVGTSVRKVENGYIVTHEGKEHVFASEESLAKGIVKLLGSKQTK